MKRERKNTSALWSPSLHHLETSDVTNRSDREKEKERENRENIIKKDRDIYGKRCEYLHHMCFISFNMKSEPNRTK